MGIDFYPAYGDDFASDIETAEKLLTKIKSGKASNDELNEFLEVAEEIVNHAFKNKD